MSSPIEQNTIDLRSILDTVNALPEAGSGGVELPELTNEGTASDMLVGKQLIDSGGSIVTGNIPTKTAGNVTVSGPTVNIPAGCYESQVSKTVATTQRATPTITVDSAGKITATTEQETGFVYEGTQTATKQLTTQAAKTITPSTSSQTAVASGVYTTGAVTVAGDTNLKAENIAEGVSIFGVTGTHSGGSSGSTNNITGDWVTLSSLMVEQTSESMSRIVMPEESTTSVTYEVPSDCIALLTLSLTNSTSVAHIATLTRPNDITNTNYYVNKTFTIYTTISSIQFNQLSDNLIEFSFESSMINESFDVYILPILSI